MQHGSRCSEVLSCQSSSASPWDSSPRAVHPEGCVLAADRTSIRLLCTNLLMLGLSSICWFYVCSVNSPLKQTVSLPNGFLNCNSMATVKEHEKTGIFFPNLCHGQYRDNGWADVRLSLLETELNRGLFLIDHSVWMSQGPWMKLKIHPWCRIHGW